MKKLFIILLFVSFNSLAGYVAGSKANQCNRTDYSSISDCQQIENEACYKVPNDSGICGIYKLANTHSGPFVNEETCSGQADCQEVLADKVCSVNHDAFINQDYSAVYCIAISGKELVIDSGLKASYDAAKLAKSQMDAALASAKKLRECGEGIIDLFLVRNFSKNLSVQQVEELTVTFAPIQNLLLNGSLVTAKTKILEAPADGIKVTASDKIALAAGVDKCLGL